MEKINLRVAMTCSFCSAFPRLHYYGAMHARHNKRKKKRFNKGSCGLHDAQPNASAANWPYAEENRVIYVVHCVF